MKLPVTTLDGDKAGEIELSEAVFGLEPRADILHRMVEYQRAKRQAGTRRVKTRGEISYTGKKMYRQKGTGGARHGDKKVAQFRGGTKAHGPVVRDHSHHLPKKLRALAMRHALSAKVKANELIIVEDAKLDEAKTKAANAAFRKLGYGEPYKSVLVIGGARLDEGFARAARNLPDVDVLPTAGANVYDILRRDALILTREALQALEARLS
jgi:large subunit ribosomal protein L4